MFAHNEPLALTPQEYAELVRSPFVDETAGNPDHAVVIVRGPNHSVLPLPRSLPFVVLWVGDEFAGLGPAAADLVVRDDEVDDIVAGIHRAPLAARTLAVLLRSIAAVDVAGGLAMESAAYSMLQAGPEFAAWRAGRPTTPISDADPTVVVARDGDVLTITLDRPDADVRPALFQ